MTNYSFRNRATRSVSLFLCFLVVCLATRIRAHPSPFSYLDLRLGEGAPHALLTVHAIDLAHELKVTPEQLLASGAAESQRPAITAWLQARLRIETDGKPVDIALSQIEVLATQQAIALHLGLQGASAPGSIRFQCALFPYDPQHQTFLNLYEAGSLAQQEIFDKNRTTFEYFRGGRQGAWAVVKRFVASGMQHIFGGPDHILFLIGLLLLGGSLGRLLGIVTAFTLAHSITLSLAALDLANPPAGWIEPAIALSIVYVGIDNLMMNKASRDMRAWIAFFFGLVHGFGFASVLKEFGLPRQALGWSLFSFNLGVEIGQACIVIVAALGLAAIRKRNEALGRHIAKWGSIAVIAAGAFWFVQRVFFS